MAIKSWYVLGTAAPSPNYYGQLQDGGTAPTDAATTYGYAPGKLAISSYCRSRLGASGTCATTATTSYVSAATGPIVGTGATNITSGDSFATPTPYSGTFASGNWTFAWNMRASVAGLVGRLGMRVWASVNASGASARELTSGEVFTAAVTLSTTANTNMSYTWAAPAITLNNEYLFFQLEYQEQTSAGSSNTDNALFRVGASIASTNFAMQWQASAVMAGAGSLVATAGLLQQLAPNALTGVGAFTINEAQWLAGKATFAGSGGLVANLSQQAAATSWQAAATLLGSGGFTISEAQWLAASATLSGAGAFTIREAQLLAVQLALAGAGSLTATAQLLKPLQSTLTGSGGFNAAVQQLGSIKSGFAGVGNFSINESMRLNAGAALAGIGGLTADLYRLILTPSIAATLIGRGSLIINEAQWLAAQSVLAGTGNLSATAQLLKPIQSLFAADGGLDASVTMQAGISTALAGSGAFIVDSNQWHAVQASFSGSGGLTADITKLGAPTLWQVQSILAGTGGFNATAQLLAQIQNTFAASGELKVDLVQWRAIQAQLAGTGAMTVNLTRRIAPGLPTTQWQGVATFTGTGALTAQLAQLLGGSAMLAGAGALTIDTWLLQNVAAQLIGTGALTVDLELMPPALGFSGGVSIAGNPQSDVTIAGQQQQTTSVGGKLQDVGGINIAGQQSVTNIGGQGHFIVKP